MAWTDEFAEIGPSMPTIKIKGSLDYSLIQEAIEKAAREYEVPVLFKMDELKEPFAGKVSGSCLMIYHPDHPSDYFQFCITMNVQGIITYVIIRPYGNSTLTNQKNKRDRHMSSRKLTHKLFGALTAEVDDSEYTAEYAYYDALQDVIMEALG